MRFCKNLKMSFEYFGLLCVCFVCVCDQVTCFRDLYPEERSTNDAEELPGVRIETEERKSRPPLDPKGSWLQFVRHSDRINNRRSHGNRRKKVKNKKILLGPVGPQGPQGPAGPPGPKGAHITKEEMMKEFHLLVKEAAEKRAEELMADRCQACSSLLNGSYVLPPEVEEIALIPRVSSAFHMRLRSNIVISRRTFMELKNFHQPFGGGAFHRGDVFDARDGRFIAPRGGVYHFAANLHIQIKRKSSTRKKLRKRDNIRVQVCIDSLCQKNTSLEFVTGVETNSKLFTTSVSGLLELKAGQYASVYVDNSSGLEIKIHSGSDFTGILFGV